MRLVVSDAPTLKNCSITDLNRKHLRGTVFATITLRHNVDNSHGMPEGSNAPICFAVEIEMMAVLFCAHYKELFCY